MPLAKGLGWAAWPSAGAAFGGDLAHGLHGGDGGPLHFEGLGGHLQGVEVHLEPVLDGLHVGDALVEFVDVEGRGDHAGQAETHLAPHVAHEFQGSCALFSVLIVVSRLFESSSD
jgi:hypothetical protein